MFPDLGMQTYNILTDFICIALFAFMCVSENRGKCIFFFQNDSMCICCEVKYVHLNQLGYHKNILMEQHLIEANMMVMKGNVQMQNENMS